MKLKLFIFSFIIMTLWSCTSSRYTKELQNQVQELEKELSKQKHENLELSSFTTSLQEQYKRPYQDYVKICQTNDTLTTDILTSKYNQLLQNYSQLQFYFNTLKDKSEIDKLNLEKKIMELKDKNLFPQKTKKSSN
jgi:hypothetical protein